MMNKKIDYTSDVNSYISNSQYWIRYNPDKIDDIAGIFKKILLHEFGLYPEGINENYIKIPTQKVSNPYNIIYKIFLLNGKPMHLDDIFIEFKRLLPEHKFTNASQLRSILHRHEYISLKNMKNVYTLKEWMQIGSVTIRGTIIEFLEKYNFPQKLNDISAYILNHFPDTNISNIKSTMLSDSKHRFVRFNDNLFGLKSKKYSSKYKKFEQSEYQNKSFKG